MVLLDIPISKDNVIFMSPNKASNNENFFQRLPRDFTTDLFVSPNILDPVNKGEITFNRNREYSQIVFQIS